MKPFNLEEAKAGKPVCTRDDRAARIICFDAANMDFPIVALVMDESDEESPETYTVDGCYSISSGDRDYDLFMAPTQHTVWVNLYRRHDMSIYAGSAVYPSEQDARASRSGAPCYIGTFPITYED